MSDISLKAEQKKHSFPRVVRIEPAAKCNLACSHCPTGTVEMVRGLMSNEVFERTFEQVKQNIEYIKVIVLYHGGEPLLNKNFYKMASAVRGVSQRLIIKTVTNGMSLNKKNISQLLNCGLDEIEISLDGLSPDENDQVRRQGSAKKVIANLKNLIKAKTSSNSNLSINIVTTQFLRSKSDVNESKKLVANTPSWLLNIFGESVNYKPYTAMKWPHMNVEKGFELVTAKGKNKDYCDHPINSITIRSNGDIVPCCYDLTSQMIMGNVMNQPLLTIFNGPKYRELRESIKKKSYISACRNCNHVRPHVYLVKTT